MADPTMHITVEQRFWFRPAFYALAIACAVISIASERAAKSLSDVGCSVLARYGVKIRGV